MTASPSSITGLLQSALERHPGRVAVRSATGTWTWEQLAGAVAARAVGLRERGVGASTTVGLVHGNTADFVVEFLAVTALGAMAVPLNPQLTGDELRSYLGPNAALGLSYGGDASVGDLASALAHDGWIEQFRAAPAGRGEAGALPAPQDDQAALCGFSSGSTGLAKRIVRSHRNLAAEAAQYQATAQIEPDDVILCSIPLFHAHALGNCLLSSLCSGAALVLLEGAQRGALLKALGNGVTVFPTVPFVLRMVSLARSQEKAPGLRLVFTAGAALDAETFGAFLDRFGVAPRQLYGNSEGGALAINLDADPRPSASSVGRALLGVSLRVVDDVDRDRAPFEPGEVVVRSASLADGYIDLPDETAISFKGGWFRTGDVGFLDEQDRLSITGRTKLFISTGGFKVDPAEVEAVIGSHPSVRDVVVVGVPVRADEELVKAVVVAGGPLTQKDIVSTCRGRLADWKIPRLVEFRDEIPRSALGKVLRKYLV